MTTVSSNQLLQAAALDPNLAFSAVFNQTQTLIQQSAYAGIQGLIQSLSESNIYTQSLEANQEALAALSQAAALRSSHQFESGDSTQVSQNQNAMISGLDSQASPLTGAVNTAKSNADSLASTISGDKNASSAAKTAATALKQAADDAAQGAADLASATTAAQVTAAITLINQAHTEQQTALADAQALPTNDSYRSQLISDASAVGTALSPVITLTTSPIATLAQTTPTVQSLNADQGNGADTISTWGNTGYVTITDSTGNGIIIQPNGKVDNLDGTSSWQFSNTGTFVLPDDTKITYNPNSGGAANITVIWGDHQMEISNLQSGSTPSTTLNDAGGRKTDASTNDGYIFNLGSNPSSWALNGGALGDTPPSREQVATSPLTNQLKVDPTAVSLSGSDYAALNQFNTTFGTTSSSIAGNNSYNDTELAAMLGNITFAVSEVQAGYDQTITNTQSAVQALDQLTQLLDDLSTQSKNLQSGSKTQLTADETNELVNIRERLEAALKQLTGTAPGSQQTSTAAQNAANSPQGTTQNPTTPPTGNLLAETELLLQGLQQFNSTVPTQTAGGGTPPLDLSLLGGANTLLGQLAGGASLTPQQVQAAAQQIATTLENAAATGGITPQALQGLAQQLASAIGQALGPGALSPQAQQALSQEILGTLSASQSISLGQLGPKALAALTQQILNTLVLPSTQNLPGHLAGNGLQAGPNPFDRLDPSNQALRRAGKLLAGFAQFSAKLDTLLPEDASFVSGTGQSQGFTNPTGVGPNTVFQSTSISGGTSSQFQGAPPTEPFSEINLTPQPGFFGFAGQNSNPGQQGGGPFSEPLGSSPPQGPTSPGFPGFNPQGQNQAALQFGATTFNTQDIIKNFQTDPQLVKLFQQRLSQAIQQQQQQISQASTLFTQAQETVKKFVQIIAKDVNIQKIILAEDLSDAQQSKYQDKMTDLRKRWGIDWGSSSDTTTPAGEQQLVARVIQSGMMV